MISGKRFNPFGMFNIIGIPKAIARNTSLTSSAKILWGVLNSHCGEDGLVYPSRDVLAVEMGMSVATVKLCIKELVEMGLIEVIPPTGDERLRHLNNKYAFIWQEWMEESTKVAIPANPADGQPASRPCGQPASRPSKQSICKQTLSDPALAGNPTTSGKDAGGGIPPWATNMANLLATSYVGVRKLPKPNIRVWAEYIHKCHTLDKFTPGEVKEMMRWYCSQLPLHYREKYFPVVECGKVFREKWGKMAGFRERLKNAENEVTDNGNGSGDGESKLPGGGGRRIEVPFDPGATYEED